MKSKKLQKALGLGMALLLVVSTAACGEKDNDKVDVNHATPTAEATPEATPTPFPEPTKDVEQKPQISEEELHQMPYEGLKDAYADYFMLGTIYTNNVTAGMDKKIVLQNYNQLTPENILKPEATQRTQGVFTLGEGKKMIQFGELNNITIHGHVLAWHQQSAPWMGKTDDREVAIQQLKDHIFGVAGELKGQIYSWDVVNEAIKDGAKLPANGDWTRCLRETQWTKSIGTDYIELAFTFAREAAPDALLYYNDYNLDDPNKAEIAAAMVADLRSRGIPVDGLGMQGHYTTGTSIGNVAHSLEMFSQIEGIKLSVSELDVGVQGLTTGKPNKEQEMKQAIFYGNLFKLYKEYADYIERVTFWGYKDNTSWRSETAPLLFNSMLEPKEAYYAVMNPELYAALDTAGEKVETKKIEAVYGTPNINGVIADDDGWDKAPKYQINQAIFAWQGATGTMQLMWDENNFYILVDVDDPVLNDSNSNLYEQDSVELFVDQNNCKKTYYDNACGQYRCSYMGKISFGSVPTEDGFKAKAFMKKGGYVVEFQIPLLTPGEAGRVIGFDAQINDANANGQRQSVMKFNATNDSAYNNPSTWAEVTLKK